MTDVLNDVLNDDILNDLEPAEETVATNTVSTQVHEETEEEKELTQKFGPIDDTLFPVGKVPLKRVEFGKDFDRKEDGSIIEGTERPNEDMLILFFDIKESFSDEYVEKHIAIHRGDDDAAKQRTNDLLAYAFRDFGSTFSSFDNLSKLTNPQILAKVIDALKNNGVNFNIPIYRGAFERKTEDGATQTIVYFRLINRKKRFGGTYSDFYRQNGGFPSLADKALFLATVTSEDDQIEAEILSVGNNVNFRRFEIEFRPKDPSPDFADRMKANGVHSYLAVYRYGDGNDNIDTEKRSRQAQKISGFLGVLDFAQWPSKIGQTVKIRVREFESQNDPGKKVYRAYLAK